MNKVILLIDHPITQNAYGEQVLGEETVITTRARVVFKGDSRADVNNEIVYNEILEFTIRSQYNVNHNMLIEYNSKKYRILGIDDTIKGQLTIIGQYINE